MNGRMIAGLEIYDPELTRLRAMYERLDQAPSKSGATKAQLREAIESRERMAVRRSELRQTGRNGADAMDVINARKDAAELAQRMKAAGYSPAQIKATVTPLLVNPGATMTGRKERKAARQKRRAERKAAGKGIFRKIGSALKKGAGFVFKGLAKVNPVLAGARVAVLSLVAKNAGGIADKMHQEGASKMRKKWQSLGGDFAKLQKAVKKGTGRPITGICGPDGPDDSPELQQDQAAEDLAAEGGGTTALDKLWELAKPIIEKLLPALGVEVGKNAKGRVQVKVSKGGAVDQRLQKELNRAFKRPDSANSAAVRDQVDDAMDPNTGDGPGTNSGQKGISAGVMLGLAALCIFALSKR